MRITKKYLENKRLCENPHVHAYYTVSNLQLINFIARLLACALCLVLHGSALGAPGPSAGLPVQVLLYGAPLSEAWLAKSALPQDGPAPRQVWQQFLRKYNIPFEATTSVERLERSGAAVLLLPSAPLLTEREMAAVRAFRARGGALLSTWQTAVRDEQGGWRGYAHMESLLGVKVDGSTEKETDDTFLITHGDNPVSHHLGAAMRVWTERLPGYYPLRLQGGQTAAQMMDWSRTRVEGRSSAVVVFDERAGPGSSSSRVVTFGFPERLWQSADPSMLEPLAHNALTWLLRIPDAFVPAWPHPYRNAVLLAVDLANPPQPADLDLGKLVGPPGGRASYYTLTQYAADPEARAVLASIKTAGHELAYLADRFEGFKDLSTAAQAKRLDLMIEEGKAMGVTPGGGMHPPVDLYDATTVRLAQARAIGYVLVGQEGTEMRLPYFAPQAAVPAGAAAPVSAPPAPIVLLPRTHPGPEDLLAEGDSAAAMRAFLGELALAEQMGVLSVIQMLGESTLTKAQLAAIGADLKSRRARSWMASGAELASWWRARSRLVASVDTAASPPVLSVTVTGAGPLGEGATVWVNLPARDSALRLAPLPGTSALPAVAKVDTWRNAVLLKGMAPGTHRWQLSFERVAP